MTGRIGLLLSVLCVVSLQAGEAVLFGHFRWGISAGADWASWGEVRTGPGPAVQGLFKYETPSDAAVSLRLGYSRHSATDRFSVSWYDSLTSSTDSASLSADRTWTSLVCGPYFEKYFTFNWQADDRKILKYLYPYLGLGLDFHFIIRLSAYSAAGDPLPGFLKGAYKTGTRLLPPTFGATARVGSKVRLSASGYLDLFCQYSVLVPEETQKGSYLNHHFCAGIGYEQKIRQSAAKPAVGE